MELCVRLISVMNEILNFLKLPFDALDAPSMKCDSGRVPSSDVENCIIISFREKFVIPVHSGAAQHLNSAAADHWATNARKRNPAVRWSDSLARNVAKSVICGGLLLHYKPKAAERAS